MNTSLIDIMCQYNLYNRSDTRKFLIKYHPDRIAAGDTELPFKNDGSQAKTNSLYNNEYGKIVEAYNHDNGSQSEKGIFCGNTFNKIKVTKKNREKIFKCMRKTANFGRIMNYHKFDKSVFNVKNFLDDLAEASPKIIQLMKNIETLDSIDKSNHGKYFKHFIFSDVKDGGYGAKIIASAFVAAGYNNVIKAKKVDGVKKLKLYIDSQDSDKNFGLLCSNSIYGSTFNEKFKKELLKLFNTRPNNIYGKNIRFIIFDSGFKEGIDLFDVKYVHIFEPSMTIADLKQTIGRATRTCGQKGLEFQPHIGWPLYVYNYYLTVPEISQDTLAASNFLTNNITKPKDKINDEDILIFKDIEKFNDTTMLYSEFDKAMNNLSIQLYDLAPKLSVDFYLTKNLHEIDDLNNEFMEKDFYLMAGGGVRTSTKKNVYKKVNKNTKFYNIDYINCRGNCGKKTTNDVPISSDFMKRVYKKYNHSTQLIPKKDQRDFFCNYMLDEDNNFCRQLNHEWGLRYAYVPEIIEAKKSFKDIVKDIDELELEVGENNEILDNDYDNLDYAGVKQKILYDDMAPATKLNFIAMRNFIKSKFNNKEFVWEPIKVENKCIPKSSTEEKSASDIELNPTQNFITKFFTPKSPYKGILLWHSVGTGKTCTGVATASRSFEKAGYSILWITRTTLKSDVWKNIFDQICHAIILEEVKLGLLLPEKLNDRKNLLSDSWLEPMSYKQFSNLLAGKNKLYDILKERNGEEDILRKTLIIIDEAHKLYGSDLKAIERPDTNVMENLILNSYTKSRQNSCKLLIMTATPFTNSPIELFNLINLFMTSEADKITTNKQEFINTYMNSDNILSEEGVKKLSNKLSGYISYLNREKDPTQFAQPIMINMPILMSHIGDKELREAVYLKKQIGKVSAETLDAIKKMREEIKKMKEVYKNEKEKINRIKKDETADCNSRFPNTSEKAEKKKCIDELKINHSKLLDELKVLTQEIKNAQDELYELNENKDIANGINKNLKDELKKIKKSFIQEYHLFQKCAHLTYKILKDNSSEKLSIDKSNNSVSNKSEKSKKVKKDRKYTVKKGQNNKGTNIYNSFSKSD